MTNMQNIKKIIKGIEYGVQDRSNPYTENWTIVSYNKSEEEAKQESEKLNNSYSKDIFVPVKIVEREFIINDTEIEVLQ